MFNTRERLISLQDKFNYYVLKLDPSAIQFFNNKNINPNHVFIADEQIYSPLIYAIKHNSVMMLRSLLTFKTIKAKAIVNDTTALAEAVESKNKLLVSLLLKSENTDYSHEEINKAFIKADNINSPTVTAILDDYFEQIIAFPEDIQRNFEKNTRILELLQKEPYRNYLYDELINYIDRIDQEEKLKLLRTMLSRDNTKEPKHPFFRILSICSLTSQLSISPLFVTPTLQIDTLEQLYIELQTENRISLSG